MEVRVPGDTLAPPPSVPLSVVSVTEGVYTELRRQIMNTMVPGQQLRPVEIASALGVSTTPVRAALERLAADGLVTQRRGHGATVAPISREDFVDIYAVRHGLEPEAARLGAPLLSDDDISEMARLRDSLETFGAASSPELDLYLRTEWSMHEICYAAAGHRRLVREIQRYRRQAERYFRLALLEGLNVVDDVQHQRDFFTACAKRDGPEAEMVARSLLDWTVSRVSPLLQDLDSSTYDP